MKKIINGKCYDTDTAKNVGSHSNGGSWSDFSHWKEILYQKKTGEFFLFGEGGPMTKYAKSCGQNEWCSGSVIIPMEYNNARKWAENNLDSNEYEATFGAISEDSNRIQLCISIQADVAEKAKRIAAEKGISFSALIEESLSRICRN